jgi:hypothetical protein
MLFRFVAGNKLNDALKLGNNYLKKNKIPIINYISENNKKKEDCFNEYKNLISNININYIIALKLSSLDFNKLLINEIAIKCKKNNLKLIIDAENDENIEKYRTIVNNLLKTYNNDNLTIIKTYQMYRKDSMDELNDDIKYFNTINNFFSAKLVRGAYWNSEYNSGNLYINKFETDNNYNNGIIKCHENINSDYILATHNKESIQIALNFNKENIIIAHLMGMNENYMSKIDNIDNINIKKACYIPYGPYNEMIPYLGRRLYENIDQIKYSIL